VNKQNPKITIITPSFNQGPYIEQTILSVLEQGYPNLEYIVVDGGSTDQTVDIIKKYEKQLAWWVSEPDRGQAHAINKGLQRTTGDIVNWLNSDDYLEPGALNALANAWAKNPNAEVICGYTHCFWHETGNTSHTYRMGTKKSRTDTLLNIEMNQPGSFYRTQIVKQLEGVNESLRYVFDNELWMRYLCVYGQKNIIKIPGLLAHFRLHGESKTIGEGSGAFHKERQSLLQHLAIETQLPDYLLKCVENDTEKTKYLSDGWNIGELNISKLHAWFANKYMVTLYNEGKVAEAKRCLKTALKHKTFEWSRKNLGLAKKLINK